MQTINVGVVTKYTLTALEKYTRYNVTVSVRNTGYQGPRSMEVEATTKEDGKIIFI